MRRLILSITILSVIFFWGCSNDLDISDAKYEPKIVIEGYIYPKRKVENVMITKNIPLNTTVDFKSILITNAKVSITDLQNNKVYDLTFNPFKFSYECNSTELIIDYGKSYKLDVIAEIDGKQLKASSVTTVPLEGFKIKKISPSSMRYRENDEFGDVKNFYVDFTFSKDVSLYIFSYLAMDASFQNFVWDNPYFKIDSTQLEKNFDRYKFQSAYLLNPYPETNLRSHKVEWLDVWFYGRHRLIIYAVDKNFKDFFLTHRRVQEPDGNFHEPKMYIEGDGIGVFGSAISDTIYFQVNR